jgi:2,3-bisphosphoglycerate-independent phosphoglycerate mutase
MTEGQKKIAEAHGTPVEFAQAVWAAVPSFISVSEAEDAIEKFNDEWRAA